MTDVVEQSDTGSETVDFDGLAITFDDRVLRPRAWTANQSRWAADLLPTLPDGPVLELCAGAGQIGLLAVVASTRHLVCVDMNPVAADFTRANARTAGMTDRVEVRLSPIADALAPDERFPLVIADPPWVPRADTGRFPEDPVLAIDGGDDGLLVVRECLAAIEAHLAEGGVALLQLGPGDQAEVVARSLVGTRLVPGERRFFGEHGALLRIDRA